jgi:hypothetical protein
VTTILKALTSSFDAVRAAPRAACIGSSLFFSASAVVAAWLSETRRRGAAAGNEEEEDGLPALSAALRDRRLAGLLLSVGALEIAVSWIEAITPLYANTAGALSPTGVGLLFAYAGVLGVIFQLPVARATQGLSGFATVLWGGAIQAVAFAVLLPSPRPPLLIAAITLLAFARMPSGRFPRSSCPSLRRTMHRRPIRPRSLSCPTCGTPPAPQSAPISTPRLRFCRGASA